jgi:hypothetical protein
MSPELLVVTKIKLLPLNRQHEVLDFIEFLQMKESIEHPDLVLSDRDRDQFLLALDRPPLQSGPLKSALMDYQQSYRDASPIDSPG